jgi:signal transduction histidine kinase
VLRLWRALQATWRLASPGTVLFSIVLVAMTTLSIASAVQLRSSYVARRRASDLAIRELAGLGAQLFSDRAQYAFERIRLQVLSSIIGMRWTAGTPVPSAEAFAVAARREIAQLQFAPNDPNLGFFVVDRETQAYAGLDAAHDPALQDSILRALRERPMAQDTGLSASGWAVVQRSEPVSVTYASLRDMQGREVAFYGFTHSRRLGWKHVGALVLRDLPLLPATWIDPRYRDGTHAARLDSLASIRLYDPSGTSIYESRPAQPGSVDGTFDVRGANALRAVASFSPALVAQMREHIGERSTAVSLGLSGDREDSTRWVDIPLNLWLPVLSILLALAAGVNLWRELSLFRARRDFVASVSHELRTPLAQIRMFTETLQLRRERDEEERLHWLGIIGRETRRLGDLVENILLFSHLDADRARLEKERTDLGELVEEVVEAYVPTAEQYGMRIVADAPSRIFAMIDPRAVRQVVVNLLDNAIKYGPRGQTISIELEKTGTSARLSIADQGPGIPVADRRSVWKPFVRLRGAKGRSGGSGIGLAVVRDLVQLHGGSVSIDAASGGGALFTLIFPISDGTEAGTMRTSAEFRALLAAHTAAHAVAARQEREDGTTRGTPPST